MRWLRRRTTRCFMAWPHELRCHDICRASSRMINNSPCPPVLVMGFNRPDTTRRVLESLRIPGPARVFLAVDGPRPGHADDAARVAQVQDLVSLLNWGCETQTLFKTDNLGCKRAVSGAISWFFQQVDAGIILEDDCVAHPSFFTYAGELLERYRDDKRVLMISGNNFQQHRRQPADSYYFSRYAHIWGWATWRRAWQHYDHQMNSWPQWRDSAALPDLLGSRHAANYWSQIFEETYQDRNTSWAYRWQFSIWAQNGLSILPRCNLVSNIGFGEHATHTTKENHPWGNLPVAPMPFPLHHPQSMTPDEKADRYTQKTVFRSPSLWSRLLGIVRHVTGRVSGRQAD